MFIFNNPRANSVLRLSAELYSQRAVSSYLRESEGDITTLLWRKENVKHSLEKKDEDEDTEQEKLKQNYFDRNIKHSIATMLHTDEEQASEMQRKRGLRLKVTADTLSSCWRNVWMSLEWKPKETC